MGQAEPCGAQCGNANVNERRGESAVWGHGGSAVCRQ